jgi:hypothetical protein
MIVSYKVIGEVQGYDQEAVHDAVCEMFAECAELRAFIQEEINTQLARRSFGQYNDLSWMSFNLIQQCLQNGFFGLLIAALLKRDPSNSKLNELVSVLERRKVIARLES